MPSTVRSIGIVEDDASLRRALQRLLRSAGFAARPYASVEEVIDQPPTALPDCFVADVRLPGLGGLELPRELARRGTSVPVILITAYDTPEARSAAKRAGAAGYFRKPVDDQALLDAIQWAIARDRTGANHGAGEAGR